MNRSLRNVLSLEDLEPAARRHLPRPLFGFVSGAAETNWSLRDNRNVFGEYGFRPRVLVGVAERSTKTTLFGHEYAAPFGIAPMGLSALIAYRGDLVLARTAAAANVPMIMSASSLIPMEQIAHTAPGTWFQAYLPGEPDRIAALVDRVSAAGFETFVHTVDVIVAANRENNIRSGFTTPLRPSVRLAWDGLIRPRWTVGTLLKTLQRHGLPRFENSYATRGAPIISQHAHRDFGERAHLNWEHLAQIRKRWRGRLVVKGVLSGEDTRIAREHGVDGVIVSNHGARQLDGAVSPLRVLPEVVECAGDMAVMIDSGFRRGSDVLKAIALGAHFVFIGRPFLYAAAIGGDPGVQRAIDLLASEIHRNMGLLGINTIAEMGRDRLVDISRA